MKQNWTYKKLGEICEIYQPKTISTEMLCSDGEFLVYGANGVIGRYNQYNHEESEVLMTCRGATCGTINISEPHSWINGNAMVIHPKTNDTFHSRTFLVYLLRSLDLSTIITGCAQPQITRMSLAPLLIPLPPLETQSRIVSELDLLQSIIDKQKAQLKEYDTLAQSIFYDMFGDPVDNDKGWEVKKLEDICLNIVDCPHSTPKKADRKTNYPCIRTSELKDGNICWDSMQYLGEDEYKIRIARLKPIAGDIVFGREGVIGDAVVLPKGYCFSLGQRTMLLRANPSIVSNIFLQKTILSEWVKKQIRMTNVSSTVAHLNIKDFKKFDFPIPPLALQQTFAAKIEAIEKQKAAISQSIAETEKLFEYTMDKYFG